MVMLQKLEIDDDFAEPVTDRSHLLQPSFYWELFKRRVLYFLAPFVLVLLAGIAAALLWPPTYYSAGKILVATQQIPSELVRATVTTIANERIQVIQQRVLARDNLNTIVTKFNLFPTRRSMLSATEVTDLMRNSILIQPVVLGTPRPGSRDSVAIAFTVGFYYEDAQVAARVANELMTQILNEDLRDRTARAVDTTRFLTRELQRLNEDYAAVDARITQLRRSQALPTDQPNSPLAQLRADYLQKSQIYSPQHPGLAALKRQIEALEKAGDPAAQPQQTVPVGLDSLETQQAALQKQIEETSRKLAAARMGETLERDQQSEKFEVIEQPTEPQEPFKPNRPRMIGIAVVLAIAAGFGMVLLREIADGSVHRPADLMAVSGLAPVITIPYIHTHAEHVRRRRILIATLAILALVVVAAVIAALFFLPPLDFLIAKARVMFSR